MYFLNAFFQRMFRLTYQIQKVRSARPRPLPLPTTSKNKKPAGHGPGKSIEKSERKSRRGEASQLNKKNGESQNLHSVSTSWHRPPTRKDREILNENFEHASDDCKKFWNHYVWNSTNFRWEPMRSRTPKGANAHRTTQYWESEVSALVPSHRRAESWTQTPSNF